MLRKSDPIVKSALLLVTGFLIMALLGTIITVYSVSRLLDSIHYTASVPSNDASMKEPALDTELPEHSDTAAPIAENSTRNILLIGQDRLEEESRARSDAIILCTFHKKDKTLTMTSFLRDLYVQIPGQQNNRINAAYTAGGMKLLRETLEENFGISVDGAVEVDFSAFTKIIDLLGGVTLELRQDEADVINKSTAGNLTEGRQLLNGKQALAYARIRKLDADGDFSRTSRQRKLLETLIRTCRSGSISTLLALAREILPMVTTDMTKKELMGYALELLPTLSQLQIQGQHIPAEGTYSYKKIRGMSVLVPDLEAARQLLQDTINGKSN